MGIALITNASGGNSGYEEVKMNPESDGKFHLECENLCNKIFDRIIPKGLRKDILPEDGTSVRIDKALLVYEKLPRWKKWLSKYTEAFWSLHRLQDQQDERRKKYPIPKTRIN